MRCDATLLVVLQELAQAVRLAMSSWGAPDAEPEELWRIASILANRVRHLVGLECLSAPAFDGFSYNTAHHLPQLNILL